MRVPSNAAGQSSDGAAEDRAVTATERSLIERMKRGEDGAYEEFVRGHGPRMMFVIRRFLPRECDAEDALQDAFLNVFRSIAEFEGESRLTTWLHRVAANAALMRIRSRARRPETLVDETSIDRLPTLGHGSSPAADLELDADASDVVRATLEGLHEDARTVVQLRDIHGIDLPEICRLLGVGMSTVKSRLRRGRTTLRAALQSQMGTVSR